MEKGTCVITLCCANCESKHHFFIDDEEAARFELGCKAESSEDGYLSVKAHEAIRVDGVIYIKPQVSE